MLSWWKDVFVVELLLVSLIQLVLANKVLLKQSCFIDCQHWWLKLKAWHFSFMVRVKLILLLWPLLELLGKRSFECTAVRVITFSRASVVRSYILKFCIRVDAWICFFRKHFTFVYIEFGSTTCRFVLWDFLAILRVWFRREMIDHLLSLWLA